MWHRVEVVLTEVSEERIASIFMVEGKIRKSAREASVRDVKSRRRLTPLLHGATSQKTAFRIVFKDLKVWTETNYSLRFSDSVVQLAFIMSVISQYSW
jgi:hypothetical protein